MIVRQPNVVNIVTGNDLLPVEFVVVDLPEERPLDVTNYTVTLKFRKRGSFTTMFTKTCTKVNGGADGLVRFFFAAADTASLTDGQYEGEVILTNGTLNKHPVYETIIFYVRRAFA